MKPPPFLLGAALVFWGLTRGASPETRRLLAKRVARNSFFVLLCSLLLGALILGAVSINRYRAVRIGED